MHKIKKIVLKNFKFFYGTKEIEFNRKHVLIYGENGSGKSSIYWALYTFFQSVFKTDPRQVQKYFLPITKSPESIKNRYALDREDSFIEIHFDDEFHDPRIKRISNTTVNTRTDNFVKQMTLSSDLIDYKSIFNIYNFTNKNRVKLFKYFEKNLMPFINLRTTLVDLDGNPISKNLNDWWNYLKVGINPYPGIYDKRYVDFQALITQFNTDLKFYLDSITETANDYLEKKFKEKIRISFKDFDDCTYNDFNKHNKGRNKITIAPEIYLTATLIDPNLDENTNKIDRVHTFLNEAKLSSIALAIRMAILKDKYVNESPKILILDDLLLSLDMGNREAVLNIILNEYCSDYQIILLTHDKVFFQSVLSHIKTHHANELRATGELNKNVLEKHFTEHWKVLEMYESSFPDKKKIPVIMEHQSNIQKAHHYFNNHDSIDYNACGNNLRAALEEFFRDFIPKDFLRDGKNNPIDKNSLTLNPLIERCILYFIHIGFNTEILDKLNRYRERALNQTSHYNPNSNYFKKELQETFEILNLLKTYQTEAMVLKDDSLLFSVVSKSGKQYSYTFKPLDDIRLYRESIDGAISFYCPADKRTYGFVDFTKEGVTEPFKVINKNKTLDEFYNETIIKLEENIGEPCIREADVFEAIKNIEGKSLIELKRY